MWLYNANLFQYCHYHAGTPDKANTPARKGITMKFYNRAPQAQFVQLPSHIDQTGLLRWLLYVAAFIFYLFTRSTTVSAADSTALFMYQLAVLVAEGLIFSSGALVGLWQVSQMFLQHHQTID